MKPWFSLILFLIFSLASSAVAAVDSALVRQQSRFDCGPAAIYDALLLSQVREPLLKALPYESFLQAYGFGRVKEGVGTELDEVAAMAREALADLQLQGLSPQFVDLKSSSLDEIYRKFEVSFEKGFNPVVGIGFRDSEGRRRGGHAVMVYKIEQMEQSLVLRYLDPQDLSLGELIVSRELRIHSTTLFSERSTPLWTLDGMIQVR